MAAPAADHRAAMVCHLGPSALQNKSTDRRVCVTDDGREEVSPASGAPDCVVNDQHYDGADDRYYDAVNIYPGYAVEAEEGD